MKIKRFVKTPLYLLNVLVAMAFYNIYLQDDVRTPCYKIHIKSATKLYTSIVSNARPEQIDMVEGPKVKRNLCGQIDFQTAERIAKRAERSGEPLKNSHSRKILRFLHHYVILIVTSCITTEVNLIDDPGIRTAHHSGTSSSGSRITDLDRYRGWKDIDILIVVEFRTTMCCSQCNRKCTKISTGGYRYLYCARCNITWNGDLDGKGAFLFYKLFQGMKYVWQIH